MKRFLGSLFIGLVCGVVTFFVIMALNTVLPSPGNLENAATAGVFAGAIGVFFIYHQNKK